jgi:hypothetical protein
VNWTQALDPKQDRRCHLPFLCLSQWQLPSIFDIKTVKKLVALRQSCYIMSWSQASDLIDCSERTWQCLDQGKNCA